MAPSKPPEKKATPPSEPALVDHVKYPASPVCQHLDGQDANHPKCKGHHSGILTKKEINDLGLIYGASDKSRKGTSYDLRLGAGHYVYSSKVDAATQTAVGWKPIWIDTDLSAMTTLNLNVEPKFTASEAPGFLQIEPYGMALVQLEEDVDTCTCLSTHGLLVCGHFDLKLKMVVKGLVSQQATQVEPYYKGKLFCYLFNQTGSRIDIKHKDRVATIEFSYVSCLGRCDKKLRDELVREFDADHHEKKYWEEAASDKPYMFCSKHGIVDVRYFQSAELRLPTHGGLNSLVATCNSLGDKIKNINDTFVERAKTAATDALQVPKALLISVAVPFSIGLTLWLITGDGCGKIKKGTNECTALRTNLTCVAQMTSALKKDATQTGRDISNEIARLRAELADLGVVLSNQAHQAYLIRQSTQSTPTNGQRFVNSGGGK